jgi:hypothetical protein
VVEHRDDRGALGQEFSPDDGKTWERNWIMTMTRVGVGLARPAQRCRPDPSAAPSLGIGFGAHAAGSVAALPMQVAEGRAVSSGLAP